MSAGFSNPKIMAMLHIVMGVCSYCSHAEHCTSDTPGGCSADVSGLLQTKVKVEDLESEDMKGKVVRTREQQRSKLLADRTYYGSLMDKSVVTYMADVPVHNTHQLPGGLNPSALELMESTKFILDFTDKASMDGFCARLDADANPCKCDTEETAIDEAIVTCSRSDLDLFLEYEKEYDYPEPTFAEAVVRQDPLPTFDVSYDEETSLLQSEQPTGGATSIWGIDRIDSASATDGTYYIYPGSKKGATAHVYVADTGIAVNHKDFEGRAHNTAECVGGSGKCTPCATSTSPTCGEDGHGHGTHCAGTIGGKTYGVAKKVNIYNMKVLNPWGYTSDIVASVNWVIQKGNKPAVWSASLGGPGKTISYEQAFAKALTGGVIISVAAGNSNSDACNFSPAFAPSAITVGSTDADDRRSSFSNYGSCLDIWAPGRNIKSADAKSNGSATMSGTSMACPHVSGVLALFMSDMSNPDPLQAEALMKTISKAGEVTDLMGSPDSMLYTGGSTKPIQPNVTYTTTTYTTTTTTTTITTTTTTTIIAGSLFECSEADEVCVCPDGEVKMGAGANFSPFVKVSGSSILCSALMLGTGANPNARNFCYCKLPGGMDGTYQGTGVAALSGLAYCMDFSGGCAAKVAFPKPLSWSSVSLSITELRGDFQSTNEYADASVNGANIGVKCSTGTDCSGGNRICLVSKDITSLLTITDKAIEVNLKASSAVGYCHPDHVYANVTIFTTKNATVDDCDDEKKKLEEYENKLKSIENDITGILNSLQ